MQAVVYKGKGNASSIQAHVGFSYKRIVCIRSYLHIPAFLISKQSAHVGYKHMLPFLISEQSVYTGYRHVLLFLISVLSAYTSYSVIHVVRQFAYIDYLHMQAM
jgi:hypothetical protein